MITLLIYDRDDVASPSATTRFGGVPSVPGTGFKWPTCKRCSGNMQFVGQIHADAPDVLHLIFMCQNDPGCCNEWDANEGGNAVICVRSTSLTLADVPADGVTLLPKCQLAKTEIVAGDDYDAARDAWAEEHTGQRRPIFGQLGSVPSWIQGDETPTCDFCEKPMRFVAQFEEGFDVESSANFGGGCAYLFRCDCERLPGKFLWQC